MTDCNHRWRFVRDWYGDPNVINGTADCSFKRCHKCGEEASLEGDEDFDAERDEAREANYER